MTDPQDPAISRDYFYKRKVIVYQHKNGYRFSVDAPILADFLPARPTREALEIGTGSGIVALLALYKKKFAAIHGLEIQPGLAHLARLNAEENGFLQNFPVTTGDFNELYNDFQGIKYIFSNPPYFETPRGRLSPNPEIRDARAETKLTLAQLLEKSYAALGKKGSLYLILPHARYARTMKLAQQTGFYTGRLRLIFSFKDGKPDRFLVQLSNYSVSFVEMKPLIIFKEKSVYTDEMDKILTG
jgi:tRNA1(Val) A37 N6-methylase TrmN6